MGMKFTEDQQRVIDLRNCNILVSAAAGSGKTAVLVERIVELVSGSGCDSARAVDIDRVTDRNVYECGGSTDAGANYEGTVRPRRGRAGQRAYKKAADADPQCEDHDHPQLLFISDQKSFQRYRSRPGFSDGGRGRNTPVEAGGFVRASGRAVRAGTAGIYRLRGIFCLRWSGKTAGRADRTVIYLFRKLSFPGKMAAAAPHGLSCGDV